MCAPPRRRQAAEPQPLQSAATDDDLRDDARGDAHDDAHESNTPHDGVRESNTPRDGGDDDVRVP